MISNFKISNFRFEFKNRWLFPPVILFIFACAPSTKIIKPLFTPASVSELRRQIDTILQDSSLYQTRTGIKVVSLQTNEILYSKDSHRLFHPASNMKLLTTALALKNLGPNFKFKTVLYADTASVVDSTIHGNIYLKGFGNPDLTTDDLRWIVQELKSDGIKVITGDLICDQSYLDDLHWGKGWMWDDVSAWQYAPISALTANDNCVNVKIKPAMNIGDSLIVRVLPPTSYMKIENLGVTVDSTDSTRLEEFKVERKWRPLPENTIVIEGGLAQQSKEKNYVIDVVNASLYVGTLFSEILNHEGVRFVGDILESTVPDTTLMLVQHLSPPLSQVVANTNKVSNNLSAELLLKIVGAKLFGLSGSAEKGLMAMNRFFDEIGVDTTTYRLVDGSGLSRYNLLNADMIVDLLKSMHVDFRIQAEFKSSLPIAGVDGTLKNRMKNTPAEGKLRAKTGTLSGVSVLSGYTTTADGELLAFSMMMEHFVVPTSKIREVQDRIGAVISGLRGITTSNSQFHKK